MEIVEEVSSSWRPMTSRIFRIAGLAYQEDHKIFYRMLHRKGGLFPTESQQLDMDKFLAGPAQYEKIHKTEQAMLDLLR